MKVTEFQTPCGTLLLTDAAGNRLPFDIVQEIWKPALTVFHEYEQRDVPLPAQDQYTVTIPAAALQTGAEYTFRLHGDFPFAYGDSDERAVANLAETDSVTLSLGAEDLNDDAKDRQAVPVMENGIRTGLRAPEQYDESQFTAYAVYPLADWSGYRFRLIDRSRAVRFRLAWVRHFPEGVEPDAYAAVTHWTII